MGAVQLMVLVAMPSLLILMGMEEIMSIISSGLTGGVLQECNDVIINSVPTVIRTSHLAR